MRKILFVILMVLSGSAGAVVQDYSQLTTYNNATFTANGQGLITGPKLNTMFQNILDTILGPNSALNIRIRSIFYGTHMADFYGAFPNDLTQDSLPGIQAAIDAAQAAGGGTVWLSPASYRTSGTIINARNVLLTCTGPAVNVFAFVADAKNGKCTIYSEVTGTTSAVFNNGVVNGVNVFQYNVITGGNPTTRAQMIALVDGMTGVGYQIGDGTNPGPAEGVRIYNSIIAGFNKCINISFSGQDRFGNIFGDCTNGFVLDGSHDDTTVDHMEFWPLLTALRGGGNVSWTIGSIADNGAGLWRITTTTAHDLLTGQTISIKRTGTGGEGIIGRWVVTAIDSTHFDLQGSVSSVIGSSNLSTSATVTSGNRFIPVTSTAGLRRGMIVTHANLPVGTKITGVWATANAISVDQYPVSSGTATLTAESVAYVGSSNTALWSAEARSGYGFQLKNTFSPSAGSEGFNCLECFPYAYQHPFHLHNAVGTSWVNGHIDGSYNRWPNEGAGVELSGYTYDNKMDFATFAANGLGILANGAATPNYPNVISTPRLYAGETLVEIGSTGSDLIINASGGGDTASNFLIRSTRDITISASRFPRAAVFSDTAVPIWYGDASMSPESDPAIMRAASLEVSNVANPNVAFRNNIAGVDDKRSLFACNTNSCYLQFLNDLGSNVSIPIQWVRAAGVTTLTRMRGDIVLNGPADTCAVLTGGGSGATCAFSAGSSFSNGTVVLTAGTGAAAVGTISITANGVLGTNFAVCVPAYDDTDTAWDAAALPIHVSAISANSVTFKWNNSGVALTNAAPYRIMYHCFGK